MRTYLKALLLAGFGTILMLEAAPSVSAADLGVTRVKKVRVVHHKKVVRRSPLVRDYDGTAVVVRRSRVVVRNYDGTLLVTHRYEVVPVTGATPSRYMNGQPVLPNYPRSWPRTFRSRYS